MKGSWMLWAVVSVCVLAASVSHAATGTCGTWVSNDGTAHLPEVNVNGVIYWATLQFEPSNDGTIMLKATDYGPMAEGHCDNSQQTFYVESEGHYRAFIPTVNYAGADYWALLELVPSADGLLWFKVTGYGNGGDWSGEGGALLATMQIEVVQASELQMTVRARSPLGLEMEITTTLLPDQPASSPSLTHSQPAEDTYEFQLTYPVPYRFLPPEGAERLLAASSPHATGDATEENVVVVTSKAILKSQGKQTLTEIVESAFGEEAAAVVRAGGKILDVLKALDIRAKHQELMKNMDALEQCAKKSGTPEQIQQTLDELAGFRNELKASTGMRFVLTMVSAAGGLIGVGVPAAGFSATAAHPLDDIDKSTLNSAGLRIGGHWDRNWWDPDATFIPFCPARWSGTFEGSYIFSMDDCTDQETKVTAEVQFVPVSSNSDFEFFQYTLESGSLHVTAADPWSTCHLGGDTWDWYLSPSSVTVSLPPTTAIILNVTPSRGDEWFAIHYELIVDPGMLGLPAMQSKLHTYNPYGDHWTTFDREELIIANGIGAAMIAAGESLYPNVISDNNLGYRIGQAKLTGRWYLKEE